MKIEEAISKEQSGLISTKSTTKIIIDTTKLKIHDSVRVKDTFFLVKKINKSFFGKIKSVELEVSIIDTK